MPDTKDCEMWVNGCPLGISVPWCFLKSKWCLIMIFFSFSAPPTESGNIQQLIFNKIRDQY